MKNALFSLMIVYFLLGGCSSDNAASPLTALEIANVSVKDISNFGNGSDLSVSFSEVANDNLEEYRIVVAKNASSVNLTTQTALELSSEKFLVVKPTDYQSSIVLEVSSVDSDGDLIVEGIPYSVYVLAVSKEVLETGFEKSMEITLEKTDLVSTIASGFSASGGIVLDESNGVIYVADFGTGDSNGTKILKFNIDGTGVGTFASGLLGPTGGALDGEGNLYWSSYSASTVHKIVDGNTEDFASVAGPAAIVLNSAGDLFVASCDANKIDKITSSGVVTTFASSSLFNCPNGLAADESGNLYVTNFEDGNVFKVSTSGSVSSFAKIPTGSSVNMTFHGGYLYITGRNANRIYKISTDSGAVSLLAGTGVRGTVDGAALSAHFSLPNGIDVSQDGKRIYVNDVSPNSGANANGPNFNPNLLRVIELVDN
ncbi:MAG: hypothetical protein ABJP45_16030 [Cyclobacteriaceae bacterium]